MKMRIKQMAETNHIKIHPDERQALSVRWLIPLLLMVTLQTANSSHLKMKLLNSQKAISVNLKNRGSTNYTVKEGDSIESIAAEHFITARELKKANARSNSQILIVGSTLKIPDQTIPLSQVLALIRSGGPLLKEAKKHLGKKYIWGANGPKTFDCSGFTCYVCKKNGICIPRTSVQQAEFGKKLSRKELKSGDLIFFDTSRERKGIVNHVGIYIGNDKFIHASSGAGKVVISSLDRPFYKQRFLWGERVAKGHPLKK